MLLKGTVAWDFDANFFIPINRPDLGDGPLMGITSWDACAQKSERFTRLALCSKDVQMLNLGYEIALPVGVNLHPRGEPALAVGVDTDRAADTQGGRYPWFAGFHLIPFLTSIYT